MRTAYSQRLEEEKKSIIESFLQDYIYGTDAQFLKNVREVEYPTRETYQGELKDGRRHGTGIFESNGGDIYLGEW